MVRIASTSSVSFIVPICAAKALPDRPATMMAVISTPSSRRVRRPTRLMVKISAPNARSCTAPCCAMTTPIRKLISPTMPKARTPTTSNRWIKACQRMRLGCISSRPMETTVCPKKPINPTKLVMPTMVASPTSASMAWKGGPCSRFSSTGSSARRTSSISCCASASPPVISASLSRAVRTSSHAPTVSRCSIAEISSTETSATSRSRRERSPICEIDRLPVKTSWRPPSPFCSSKSARALITCANGRLKPWAQAPNRC